MKKRNSFPAAYLGDLNDLHHDLFAEIEVKDNFSENLLTIDQLEIKYWEFNKKRWDLDDQCLSHFYSNTDERHIIKACKEEYYSYGIRLRTNVRSPITIQTENRRITINRYLLTPVTKEDDILLFQRDGCHGVYPLDRVIKINNLPFKMTVEAMLKVSKKSQESMSYQLARDSLAEDCGINLDVSTICDVTNHIGFLVFKNDLEKATETFSSLQKGTYDFPNEQEKATLYLQTDGCMVNIRETSTSQPGWRKNKLGMVYNSNDMKPYIRTVNGKKVLNHIILHKNYTSYIGSVDGFQKLFFKLATDNGYGKFENTVLISDGASWIGKMKDYLFPDALHILDFFHVSEKIWELGKKYFKEDPSKYTPWCKMICDKIEDNEYKSVRSDIESKEKSKRLNKPLNITEYLDKNILSMNYKLYKSLGLSIGSGAIEGSNRHVIQSRLILPGMRWNLSSAQAVAILRCKFKSGSWYSDVVSPVRRHYGLTYL
jgi:hypothetical protein